MTTALPEYDLVRTGAPGALAVTAAELRDHLRLDGTDQDTYLETLLNTAIEKVEEDTGRALITQTWKLHLPRFWSGSLELPRSPLQSVTSITYIDTDGNSQTLATSEYDVITEAQVGRIETAYGKTLPSTRSTSQAVTITFVAGWGAAGANVIAKARHAVKLLAAHYFAHSEPVTVHGPAPASVPETYRALIAEFTARGAL